MTRQVFTGAGKVLRTISGSQFCLSQRAQHICQEMSGGTTTARAIINTRDETLADSNRYRRLHLILGDSNMSEVTTYLKVGTTALVIDMIEDGWLNGDYSLHAPVDALRTISRDPTLRATVKLKDGRLLTALRSSTSTWSGLSGTRSPLDVTPSGETSWAGGRAPSSDSSTNRSSSTGRSTGSSSSAR